MKIFVDSLNIKSKRCAIVQHNPPAHTDKYITP